MKSILLSIKPKYVELIANEEKTIEVRKTSPKCEVPFKCYIYATKKKHLIAVYKNGEYIFSDDHSFGKFDKNILVKDIHRWQGKVIGEFICNKIDKFNLPYPAYFNEVPQEVKDLIKLACLTMTETHHYLGQKAGYGWHISDLKIYDKPKELSEFFTPMGKRPSYMVERPPQSWCYVEELQKEKK